VFSLVIVGFGFFILSIMFNPIASKVNDLRTDQQIDTGLACSTGSATECTVTLTEKSAYEPVAPNWTVTETSPGSVNRTATSVLSSNLQDVTVSGLTASTSYVFTIDYYKVDTNVENATSLNSVLKRFNLLIVIGLLIILVVGAGLSFNFVSSSRGFG